MVYKIEKTEEYIANLLGEMPNIKIPTFGGKVFWDTKKSYDTYKLQVNKVTNHARILGKNNKRIAWGSYQAMEEKFQLLTKYDSLAPGDVIGVNRWGGLYKHYAIYIGDDEVIHYAGDGKDFGTEVIIHRAPMKEFLKDSEDYFVLDFPDKYGMPNKKNACLPLGGRAFHMLKILINSKNYHLYSGAETVRRAEARLGERKYNIVFNNCEHFAIWCKTGISESHQVSQILEIMPMLRFRIL